MPIFYLIAKSHDIFFIVALGYPKTIGLMTLISQTAAQGYVLPK